MNTAQQNRSSSHGRKLPEHARPSKAPQLTRSRHSYGLGRGHGHVHARPASHHAPKHGAGWSKKLPGSTVPQADFEEDVFTDFLQYCAQCERQITDTISNGLYCSEACRKKDEAKPTSLVTPLSTTTSHSYFESPSASTTNIIQPLSPTILRPRSEDLSDFWLGDSDHSSVDGEESEDENPDHRRDSGSGAADYLSQFHHFHLDDDPSEFYENMLSHHHPHHQHHHQHHQSEDAKSGWRTPPQPRFRRALTTATSSSTLPSLCTTPSSVSTAASFNGGRPALPSRYHPWSASSHVKSVDLVTPLPILQRNPRSRPSEQQQQYQPPPRQQQPSDDISSSMMSSASTLTSFQIGDGHASPPSSYDKRKLTGVKSAEKRRGSLKQLFSHDEMRKSPGHGG